MEWLHDLPNDTDLMPIVTEALRIQQEYDHRDEE